MYAAVYVHPLGMRYEVDKAGQCSSSVNCVPLPLNYFVTKCAVIWLGSFDLLWLNSSVFLKYWGLVPLVFRFCPVIHVPVYIVYLSSILTNQLRNDSLRLLHHANIPFVPSISIDGAGIGDKGRLIPKDVNLNIVRFPLF